MEHMRTSYTTSRGVRYRTASERRYVVVDASDGRVIYRSDNALRALARRTLEGAARHDVVDTERGGQVIS